MNEQPKDENLDLREQLERLSDTVKTMAGRQEGNTGGLLNILRTLEGLHREIRIDLFEPTLPDTRKDLYDLLKDIEESGGWPYIERMKLQSLLIGFIRGEDNNPDNVEK